MLPNNFNFAQPLWLWGLLLIPAGWAWRRYGYLLLSSQLKFLNKFADAKLLPYLLLPTTQSKQRNFNSLIYASLIASIILAFANPRWNYTDVEAYAPTASAVLLLDLSSTMNAKDILPSRIIHARQNIEDLLNLSKGLKVGLIGFAAIPHLISPITDDIQTLKTFLPAVHTDLITKQGGELGLALNAAASLLMNEPGDIKSVVLISDGNFTDADYSAKIHALLGQNIKVHVIGIGTANGIPRIDQKKLQAIAKQGNGIYVETNFSDRGLQAILAKVQQTSSTQQIANGTIRQWQDRYYLFLLPAAALFLYLVAKRAFYVPCVIILASAIYSPDSQAFELKNLFKNSERLAAEQFLQANFAQAAEKFNDPYNKGVALYRAAQYAAAEQQFKSANHLYNAGNAQMQQKKWRAAIHSYETFLQANPEHADAKFNLELAKKMLAQNKDQDQDENKNKDQNKNQDQEQEQEQKQEQNQNQDQEKNNEQESEPKPKSAAQAAQDARADLWLNRIDSDIKVFLKNKFYIEDVLSAK